MVIVPAAFIIEYDCITFPPAGGYATFKIPLLFPKQIVSFVTGNAKGAFKDFSFPLFVAVVRLLGAAPIAAHPKHVTITTAALNRLKNIFIV
jgi:hypothetical protein